MSVTDPPATPASSPTTGPVPAEDLGAVEIGDPWELLDEARAALQWAAWGGQAHVAWERAPLPASARPTHPREGAAAAPTPPAPPRSTPAAAPPAPPSPAPSAGAALRQRTGLRQRPALRRRNAAPAPGAPPATRRPPVASAPAARPAAAHGAPPAAAPRRSRVCSAEELAARSDRISALHARIGDCERCELSRRRRHIVHGVGALDARLVIIGSGPYDDEDGAGQPFAGDDGALLDRMLAAMGLRRSEVFLTGLVRCHLGANQEPDGAELTSCTPFLRTELTTISPEVVVLMGDAASRFLLKQPGVAKARGRWHTLLKLPTLATWGLPTLRQQPHRKREVWHDLQLVMKRLGLERPK